MSWLERPTKTNTNPAVKFLEWSSNDKCFKYYDKEKGQNVKVELPLKFVILEHYHTVKGWNDASESGIYSNEVLFLSSEELEVKAFKGGQIAKGFYKEIKHNVNNAGGHYCRSIYAVTKDLELVNISLKGSAVREYSEFVKTFNEQSFNKNWVEVAEAKDMKKGAVKYSVPVFKSSTAIKDKSKILPYAQQLTDYMLEYMNKDSLSNTEVVDAEQVTADDDLAF